MDEDLKKEDIQFEDNSLIGIISSAEIPTREENFELIRRAKSGDKTAYEEIIIRNGRLVLKELKKYSWYQDTYDDLLQEGLMGIGRAIEKFNFDYNTAFSTYAIHWINQYIRLYITKKTGSITYPSEIINKALKLKRLNQDRFANGEPELTNEEALQMLGLGKASDMNIINSYLASLVYLDAESSEAEDLFIRDFIKSQDEEIEDAYIQKDTSEYLIAFIQDKLTEREADVVFMHYGFPPYDKAHKFDDIGDKYSITKQRAEQIHKKAIEKLKDSKIIAQIK